MMHEFPSPAGPFRTNDSIAETDGAARDSGHELIARLQAELRLKDREVEELRSELRAVHTSDAWAMLRTVSQVRHALAPHGTRRDQLARRGVRGLRRLKKGVALVPQVTRSVLQAITGGGTSPIRVEPATRGKHAVICLPIIEWGFRFQRPQQMMRQFSRASHLVLYAANRFHGGTDARLRLIETNLLEALLPGDPAANVYQSLPPEIETRKMVAAFEKLHGRMHLADAVIVAQVPHWTALAEALRARFGWPIVYDCMDDHAGFLHNTFQILEAETRLVATADLVVASSELLLGKIQRGARATILLRNACDYEHFSTFIDRPREPRESPRVGYYGAIAEWFNSKLVSDLARARPDWRFELIGSTLAGDVRTLEDVPNVRLLGERPYDELPRLLRDWDVYIIPFKRVPLTEATNPVKVYEMLATGKPVVATGLPELIPIAQQGLIRLAETALEFAGAIEMSLSPPAPALAEHRRAFARQNTWHARHVELTAAIDEILRRRRPEAPDREGTVTSASALAGR